MPKLFIKFYTWLTASNARYWLSLMAVVAVLAILSLRVRPTSDISDFFPEASEETDYVMHHLKATSKTTFVVMPADSLAPDQDADLDMLIAAAEECRNSLVKTLGDLVVVSLEQPDDYMEEAISYVYSNLPFLLTDEDYAEIARRLNQDSIRQRIAQDKILIASMTGQALAPVLAQDPLMLASGPLSRLAQLGEGVALTETDGFLTSQDGSRLVFFADIAPGHTGTGVEEMVADAIDKAIEQAEQDHDVRVYAYGAPQVSASNSRRVTDDIWLTMSVSLTVLIIVMLLVFRSAKSVALLVVFGVLFAFGVLGACGCELSQLALAAGAMVMGISLSYSIHMVTHGLHVKDATKLLDDMAWPMTVGSLTTIGAFLALLFTSSTVLKDLGLFATLVMIGSLLFCLIFLPRLMSFSHDGRAGKAMSVLDNLASVDWSRSRVAVALLGVVLVVSLFNFNKVGFNSELSALNYVGHGRLEQALPVIEKTLGVDGHKSTVVVTGHNVDELADNALRLSADSERLRTQGLNRCSSVAPSLLVSLDEQKRRLALWDTIWDEGVADITLQAVSEFASKEGFHSNAFSQFGQLLKAQWRPSLPDVETLQSSTLFKEWVSSGDSLLMLTANVEMDIESRDALLDSLAAIPHVVQTDMGYYASKSTTAMIDDFNWLLLVSSVIVGGALLLSYGRLELFAMTFLPMTISWVIILGLMALFNVEFNVINIILSTFVFGVGDDYSIFIMDGLLSERSAKGGTLTSHKTAIILSAFAAMAGLGAQAFGLHPAVRSMGLLSVFGLVAVVITSFIIQPLLFRLLISEPAQKGHPYTALSLLRSLIMNCSFVLTCAICYAAWLVLSIFVRRKDLRQDILHKFAFRAVKAYAVMMRPLHDIKPIEGIDFEKPSVLVANHQSVADSLRLLVSSPKIVFVVKTWVAKAPILGNVVRALGFYNVEEKNGKPMLDEIGQLVNRGYSIVVFPEGERSTDLAVHRFHKGAFLLAKELNINMTPIVFYGNGMVVSKKQPLHVMKGLMVAEVLPQVSPDNFQGENAVRDMTKAVQMQVRKRYAELCEQYDPVNPYFAEAERMDNLYKI